MSTKLVTVWGGSWRVVGTGPRGTLLEHLSLKDDDGKPVRRWAHESVKVQPSARVSDPVTSHMAAAAQTPAKVRSEHRLILELLQWEPLSDFDLAQRASQALGRTVKQTSLGVRRGELTKLGLVTDSGLKGTSDTGAKCIRWVLTPDGQKELAA